MRFLYFITFLVSTHIGLAQQGPYAPAADQPGTDAIPSSSNLIYQWATGVEVQRGSIHLGQSGVPLASSGDDDFSLGFADGGCTSLGDRGWAVLTFDEPLQDRAGADFAVFENGFYSPADSGYFLELAFVEVSSNGLDYVRFPAHSLTQTQSNIGTFGVLNPTNLNNLAGKYATGFGTPFDLNELEDSVLVDIQNVTHVRIIDVVGSLDASTANVDTAGNFINDPFPTVFASGGFDLDAVAGINEALDANTNLNVDKIEVSTVWRNQVWIKNASGFQYRIFSVSGQLLDQGVVESSHEQLDATLFNKGLYLMLLQDGSFTKTFTCVKQ